MRRTYRFRLPVMVAVTLFALITIVQAAPSSQANLFQLFLLNLQSDIETLGDEVFGADRPAAWTNNDDVESPLFVADLWFNTEQLADSVFGIGERPENWIGATASEPEFLSRNVRHDLELIADQIFGDARTRPETWVGARPVYRCSRTLQNLIRILDQVYNTRTTTPDSVLDYCAVVSNELRDTILPNILQNTEFAGQSEALLSGLRGDLERLADERLGLGTRPPGWAGNRDAASGGFNDELFRDMELLADNQLGTGNRPPGWLSVSPAAPTQTYLNLRLNLETLADQGLGISVRPTGWQGVNPVERCDVLAQSLVIFVGEQIAPVPLPADVSDPTVFCPLIERAANDTYENPPAPEVVEVEEGLIWKSRLAFSYLDVAALQYMGVMPQDTEFRAWYRNFNESNMMFVSGENFALFIDRRFTTMPEERFRNLPTLEGRKPLTFCDASWCNGPGPTPTPTGDGPLVLLLSESTPEPTRDPGQLEQQGKRLVSWNNIRVNYLLDRPETGTVQVTLEICSDPTQVACEPVINVFDNTTGTSRPVISQFNGLNVYEFPYGYSTNFLIEGTTLYARDIWISDPAIRG
jgi:hypothetical protein